MAKQDDIPKTDPSEIEALIQRLKQSNLEPRDTQLVERLLRLMLSMALLLRVPAVRKLDSAFRHPDCSLCGNLAHAISATGRDLA
jgi:hypothetical protein